VDCVIAVSQAAQYQLHSVNGVKLTLHTA